MVLMQLHGLAHGGSVCFVLVRQMLQVLSVVGVAAAE